MNDNISLSQSLTAYKDKSYRWFLEIQYPLRLSYFLCFLLCVRLDEVLHLYECLQLCQDKCQAKSFATTYLIKKLGLPSSIFVWMNQTIRTWWSENNSEHMLTVFTRFTDPWTQTSSMFPHFLQFQENFWRIRLRSDTFSLTEFRSAQSVQFLHTKMLIWKHTRTGPKRDYSPIFSRSH